MKNYKYSGILYILAIVVNISIYSKSNAQIVDCIDYDKLVNCNLERFADVDIENIEFQEMIMGCKEDASKPVGTDVSPRQIRKTEENMTLYKEIAEKSKNIAELRNNNIRSGTLYDSLIYNIKQLTIKIWAKK